MLKYSLVALAVALPTLAQQQQVWGQCGGTGWTGPTSCVSGTNCVKVNDWYSQCQPGSAPTTAAPPPPPPVTTTAAPPPPPSTTTAAPPLPPSTTTAGTAPTTVPGTCAALPGSITLRANSRLPDPFTFVDGSKVTTKAQWECRREEISQLVQRYESGTMPPRPQSVTGTRSGNSITVSVSDSGRSISFSASISYPSGTGPFPALIAVGGSSIPTPSGVAVINFPNDDIAAQASTGSRGQGKFYTLYGNTHSASALVAWAWGVGRLIDALETTANTNIDTSKLAVTGCSRNGKGALAVGAFEPRIALTIPQESGSGGAGCWRISDRMKANGINTQTASQIITENVWFSRNFDPYVNRINDLPFDHHMYAGMIAPRGLLIIENTGIDWLGPQSNWGCMKTANKIWQALGVADNMGVSQVGNHNHCAFPSNQQNDLNAFVNKFLKGQSANTNIVKTDGANQLGFNDADWIDWAIPTLS